MPRQLWGRFRPPCCCGQGHGFTSGQVVPSFAPERQLKAPWPKIEAFSEVQILIDLRVAVLLLAAACGFWAPRARRAKES